MNPRDSMRVLDDVSNEKVPQDIDLLPGILAKINKDKEITLKSSLRFRYAGLMVLLIILAVIFTRPGVVSALQKLIGYIPGVGTVDRDAPLRVLANPVSDTRGEFTITVDSAVLDSTRTVIDLRISGPFLTWEDPARKPTTCQKRAFLRLEDGEELVLSTQSGSYGGGQAGWQLIFPAVPAAENSALLVLPCLPELPEGDGPQNWDIPLTFIPAPPDMTVYPLVDLPAATPEAADKTEVPSEIQFTLESMAQLDEGYYLQTVLSWPDDPAVTEIQFFPDSIHLVDSSGQEIPVWLADPMPPAAPAQAGSLALNLQTGPVLNPGPASLVIDYIGVGQLAAGSFSIDVGANPQPGQSWEVNKNLEINGYSLRVISAEYIQAAPGDNAMLMLTLASHPDILTVDAVDMQHEIIGKGGSPANEQTPLRAGWYYKDGFPQGIISVDINGITVRRPGPWTLTWMPVELIAAPDDKVDPFPLSRCMVERSEPTSVSNLPAELGGRIVLSVSKGDTLDNFIANLDGRDRIQLGPGFFVDVSPDGQRFAYRGADKNLHVRDLSGGSDLTITGENGETMPALSPKWSPDGQQIAFTRVIGHTTDVYLVDPDGSDLHAVLDGPEGENLLGWAPDGSSIFYLVWLGDDGVSVREFDLQTGLSSEKALLPAKSAQIVLSPDGERIVHTDDSGVWLTAVDGSDFALLLSGRMSFGNILWSPDSRWIAMSDWESNDTVALLHADTCEMIYLDGQSGSWQSWLK